MKRLPLLLIVLLVLGGCSAVSTIERRSQEKTAAWSAASSAQQAVMRRGLIALGFTPDMVYIALDKPDSTLKLPDGRTERWIYRNVGQTPASSMMGLTRVAGGGPFGGGGDVSRPSAPVAGPGGVMITSAARNVSGGSIATRSDPSQVVDAFQQHLVVVFTDGKLTSMELFEM